MRFSVHLHQPADIEVRVALRGAEARVAEQFLNRAKVGTGLEKMRRKRVPKRVRADAAGERGLAHVPAHDPIHAAGGESLSAKIQEERLPSPHLTRRLSSGMGSLFLNGNC